MAKTCALQMAARKGYAALLREEAHRADIKSMGRRKMKLIRKKAAQFIFCHKQLVVAFEKKIIFDDARVNFEDIEDDARYYLGFLLVSSTSAHFVCTARLKTCADAAHCQEVGSKLYGTIFQVMSFDANNDVFPLVVARSVATESTETWNLVFQACRNIEGFDVPKLVCIVNQDKSSDPFFADVITHT